MSLPQAKGEPPQPTAMMELAPAERFVVWCFRRWVQGLQENNGRHSSLVWNEFAKQMGVQDGKQALATFIKLIDGLRSHARRPIHHHQPCCSCLGGDEIWLIRLIAACQHQRSDLAARLVDGMVQAEGRGDVFAAAARLAHIIGRNALTLPVREEGGRAAVTVDWPAAGTATVH